MSFEGLNISIVFFMHKKQPRAFLAELCSILLKILSLHETSRLENQAKPNLQDSSGDTPLHLVVLHGSRDPIESSGIVKILLKNEAKPNLQNSDGLAPLHIAVREGTPEIVKILLERGADPNMRDKDEKTPLDYAKEKDAKEIIKHFEEQEKRELEARGKSLLDAAQRNNLEEVRKLLA